MTYDDQIASLYNELRPLSPHSNPWLLLTPEQQQAVRNVADRQHNIGFDDGEKQHFDRLKTIIDEAFGLQPVMTPSESLTFLERELFRARQAREEKRAAIERLAESLHNASGNPFISGVDDRLLKHVSEKLRELA